MLFSTFVEKDQQESSEENCVSEGSLNGLGVSEEIDVVPLENFIELFAYVRRSSLIDLRECCMCSCVLFNYGSQLLIDRFSNVVFVGVYHLIEAQAMSDLTRHHCHIEDKVCGVFKLRHLNIHVCT